MRSATAPPASVAHDEHSCDRFVLPRSSSGASSCSRMKPELMFASQIRVQCLHLRFERNVSDSYSSAPACAVVVVEEVVFTRENRVEPAKRIRSYGTLATLRCNAATNYATLAEICQIIRILSRVRRFQGFLPHIANVQIPSRLCVFYCQALLPRPKTPENVRLGKLCQSAHRL